MVEISTFVSRLWVCLSCQVTRLADSPHLPPLSHPSVIKVAYFCSVHIDAKLFMPGIWWSATQPC